MRLLVYHNPNAGHDAVPGEVLREELQRAGHEVVWVEKGTVELDRVLDQPLDGVVVAGGDGSVGTVGRALAGRDVPIAILPRGTANNIASLVGARPDNLLERLAGGRIMTFDVGILEREGRRVSFLEGVGFGAFAETAAMLTAREAVAQTVHGRADELDRDLDALREWAARVEPAFCEIDIDGTKMAGGFLMVEVTNAGMVGPNLRLAPDAVPFDGMLDVAVVDVAERDELQTFLGAHRRDPRPEPGFMIRRARRVRLRLPGGLKLHIDGDTIESADPLELCLEIAPAALRFFAPAAPSRLGII